MSNRRKSILYECHTPRQQININHLQTAVKRPAPAVRLRPGPLRKQSLAGRAVTSPARAECRRRRGAPPTRPGETGGELSSQRAAPQRRLGRQPSPSDPGGPASPSQHAPKSGAGAQPGRKHKGREDARQAERIPPPGAASPPLLPCVPGPPLAERGPRVVRRGASLVARAPLTLRREWCVCGGVGEASGAAAGAAC